MEIDLSRKNSVCESNIAHKLGRDESNIARKLGRDEIRTAKLSVTKISPTQESGVFEARTTFIPGLCEKSVGTEGDSFKANVTCECSIFEKNRAVPELGVVEPGLATKYKARKRCELSEIDIREVDRVVDVWDGLAFESACVQRQSYSFHVFICERLIYGPVIWPIKFGPKRIFHHPTIRGSPLRH